MNLPNMKKPCVTCPFRKDTVKGWLGTERMATIIKQDSFVCHKTIEGSVGGRRQCAGHMLITREHNTFYRMAKRMGLLELEGEDLVFDSIAKCVNHHKKLSNSEIANDYKEDTHSVIERKGEAR